MYQYRYVQAVRSQRYRPPVRVRIPRVEASKPRMRSKSERRPVKAA